MSGACVTITQCHGRRQFKWFSMLTTQQVTPLQDIHLTSYCSISDQTGQKSSQCPSQRQQFPGPYIAWIECSRKSRQESGLLKRKEQVEQEARRMLSTALEKGYASSYNQDRGTWERSCMPGNLKSIRWSGGMATPTRFSRYRDLGEPWFVITTSWKRHQNKTCGGRVDRVWPALKMRRGHLRLGTTRGRVRYHRSTSRAEVVDSDGTRPFCRQIQGEGDTPRNRRWRDRKAAMGLIGDARHRAMDNANTLEFALYIGFMRFT